MVHQIVEEHCDLIHVVRHGESCLGPTLTGSPPSAGKIRTIGQQGHGLRHPPTVAFLYQPSGLLIHNHVRYPAMTGGHNGQTTQLRFHHRDRASLLITIFRCTGMLYEHPCTPHLLHHRIGRKNTWELNKMLESQLASPFLHDGKERSITSHDQAAGISLIRQASQESEGFQGVQRTFLATKRPTARNRGGMEAGVAP